MKAGRFLLQVFPLLVEQAQGFLLVQDGAGRWPGRLPRVPDEEAPGRFPRLRRAGRERSQGLFEENLFFPPFLDRRHVGGSGAEVQDAELAQFVQRVLLLFPAGDHRGFLHRDDHEASTLLSRLFLAILPRDHRGGLLVAEEYIDAADAFDRLGDLDLFKEVHPLAGHLQFGRQQDDLPAQQADLHVKARESGEQGEGFVDPGRGQEQVVAPGHEIQWI